MSVHLLEADWSVEPFMLLLYGVQWLFDESSFPLWITSSLNHSDDIYLAVLHISMVTAVIVLCELLMSVKRPWHVENIWFYTCHSILYEWEVWCMWMFSLLTWHWQWRNYFHIGACFFCFVFFCMWLGLWSRMTRGKWLQSRRCYGIM